MTFSWSKATAVETKSDARRSFEESWRTASIRDHLIRVRANRAHCDPDFLSAYLNSARGKDQMSRIAQTTTGLHTLSVSKIETLEVPAPPVSVQKMVVATLAEHTASVARIQAAVAQQAKVAAALSAALYRAAFHHATSEE